MKNSNFNPVNRKTGLVVQEAGNEILIYDLDKNKAFNLNQTSALVWQLCDGRRTVAEIAKNMAGKLDSVITEDFVWLAIDQLKKDNLLEDSANIPVHFAGLSRREVIRKVGLASLVALPVVASIVAPTAVHAASGLPLGAQCPATGGNTSCASGCCGTSNPGGSGPFTCVTPNIDPTGNNCINGCECSSGLCVSNQCAPPPP